MLRSTPNKLSWRKGKKWAKKIKILAGLTNEERKAISIMEFFYRKKLFGENTMKKKKTDKEGDKTKKGEEHKNKPSF